MKLMTLLAIFLCLLPAMAQTSATVKADLNNDGHLEVISLNDTRLQIDDEVIQLTSSPQRFTVEDVDLDGFLDVVLDGEPLDLSLDTVRSSEKTIPYTPLWNSGATRMDNATRHTIYDLDGDGRLELVAADYNDSIATLRIFEQNGDDWIENWSLDGGLGLFSAMTAADVDGDGNVELIVGKAGSFGEVDGPLLIIIQATGDDTYVVEDAFDVSVGTVKTMDDLWVTQMNGTGPPEIVVGMADRSTATKGHGVSIYGYNVGSGLYEVQFDHFIGSSEYLTAITAGDSDGDGLMEIIFFNRIAVTLRRYEWNGSTYVYKTTPSGISRGSGLDLMLADVDDQPGPEILVGFGGDSHFAVLKATGDDQYEVLFEDDAGFGNTVLHMDVDDSVSPPFIGMAAHSAEVGIFRFNSDSQSFDLRSKFTVADASQCHEITIGRLDDDGCDPDIMVTRFRGLFTSGDYQLLEPDPVAAAGECTFLTEAHLAFENDFLDRNQTYQATPMGQPVFANGRLGQALDLDGVDDYLVTDQILPTQLNGSFSFAAWVKADQLSGWQTIVSTYQSGAQIGLHHDRLKFGKNGNGTWWLVSEPLFLGHWYFVAGTFDGTTANLYINGKLIRSRADQSYGAPHGVSVVGSHKLSGSELFEGLMDEVRIYPWALSAESVAGLYLEDLCDGADGAHFSLDNHLLDNSGNGHGVTALGDPMFDDGRVGAGLLFDGWDDRLITDPILAPDQAADFMFSAWIKPDGSGGWQTIISTQDSGAQLALKNNRLKFGKNGANPWWLNGPYLHPGVWYHVGVIHNISGNSLFLNGKFINFNNLTFDQAHGVSYTGSYKSSGAELFSGQIDEVRITSGTVDFNVVVQDFQADLAEALSYGFYAFEDNTSDASGNGLDAVSIGTLGFTDGYKNRAAAFDGDDWVQCSQILLPDSTSSFSFAAWVKPSDLSGWKTIVGTQVSGAQIAIKNNRFKFGKNGSSPWWVTSGELSPDTWYHVAGTYDGTTARLYVNGAEVANLAGRAFAEQHGESLIGSYHENGSELMHGLIDEVGIYPYLLTPAEVADLYGEIKGFD